MSKRKFDVLLEATNMIIEKENNVLWNKFKTENKNILEKKFNNLFPQYTHISENFKYIYIAFMQKDKNIEKYLNAIEITTISSYVINLILRNYDLLAQNIINKIPSMSNKLFIMICNKGNYAVYIKYISIFDNLNINTIYNQTNILHNLITNGNNAIVKHILQNFKNININFQNKYGLTILMSAILKGNLEIIDEILSMDCKENVLINLQNNNGYTALMIAIKSNNIEIARKMFLFSNLDINIKDNKNDTVLYNAITVNNYEIVNKILTEYDNIDINCKNNNELTPIMYALSLDYIDIRIIKKIIEYPNVDLQVKTPRGSNLLMIVLLHSNFEIIKLLLDKKIFNINQKNIYNTTALMIACKFTNNIDIIKELLKIDNIEINKNVTDAALSNKNDEIRIQLINILNIKMFSSFKSHQILP